MLYLISLGLVDEKDMSLRALETAKQCDSLYMELYTTKMETDTKKVGDLVGKPVKDLQRSGMEEESAKIIEEAKTRNVGVFVGGDALSATTHLSLLMDAKAQGVCVKVIHGSSVLTAVAETGLQLYKFGAATTLAYPQKNYKPTSCYDTMLKNKKIKLHTLILLDVKPPRYMSVKEGLEILLDIEKEMKENLVTEDTFFVAASQLGSTEQKIKYRKAKDLMEENFGQPAVLILPGDLHFLEKEFLENL